MKTTKLKKNFLTLVCLLTASYFFAQKSSDQSPLKVEIVKESTTKEVDIQKHNEIRLNLLSALVFTALDVSYERTIDANSSYGATLFYKDNAENNSDVNFYFKPYYRNYFFDKNDYGLSGIFIEVSTSVASIENVNSMNPPEDATEIGFGLGLGQKWVNNNGFSLELLLGMNRYLTSTNTEQLQIGISLGKRF